MANDSAWPTHTEVAPWASARTAHLSSLSAGVVAVDDSTRPGGRGGRVYDFHGMTAASSGQKLARIFAGKELVESARPIVDSRSTVPDSAQVAAADVPFVSPSVIKPVSYQTGPGDRSMTPEEQAAANQARRDEQTQTPPVPGANQPSQGAAVQPANNPAPQQNPQPVSPNQNPQQAPVITNPGTDKPGDSVGQPASAPTLPSEGVPWETTADNGAVATSVIVAGTGGQTIDTTIRNTDGTITQVRSVSDGNGGVTTWTANADGSYSVRYPDGTNGAPPGQAKIYTAPVGMDPSGPAQISTDIGADGKNAHTESVNPDGTVSTADSKVRNDGTVRTDYTNPNGSTGSTLSTPVGNGVIKTATISDIDSNGYGYHTDDEGVRWDVTPTSREGFDHAALELHVQQKEGDNFRERVFDKYGHLISDQLYDPAGSLLGGTIRKNGVRVDAAPLSVVRKQADDQMNRAIMVAYATSGDKNKPDLSNPDYIAAQQLSDMIRNLEGDKNAMVKTVWQDGLLVQVSVAGKNGIDHVVSIGEKPGKASDPNRFLQFDLYPDGSMIDSHGNHLVQVGDSIIRYDVDGRAVIPDSSEARKPTIVGHSWVNGGEYDFEVEPKAFENTSNRRFVHRPDTGVNAEMIEVPMPPGVSADKVYKVVGGGVMIEDSSGIHWATEPGRGPSAADQFEDLAFELATLAVLDGTGRVAFRVGAKVASAFKAREAAALAREAAAAATAAAQRAAPSIAANTARTGLADSTAPVAWRGSAASDSVPKAGLPTEQPSVSWGGSAGVDGLPKIAVPKEPSPAPWSSSASSNPVPRAGLPESGPTVPVSGKAETAESSLEAAVQTEGPAHTRGGQSPQASISEVKKPSAPTDAVRPSVSGEPRMAVSGEGLPGGSRALYEPFQWGGRFPGLSESERRKAVLELQRTLLNGDDLGVIRSSLSKLNNLGVNVDRELLARIRQYNFNNPGLELRVENFDAWFRLSRKDALVGSENKVKATIGDAAYILHEAEELAALERIKRVTGFDYTGQSLGSSPGALGGFRIQFKDFYHEAHEKALWEEYKFISKAVSYITNGRVNLSPIVAAAIDPVRAEGLEYMIVNGRPLHQSRELAAWIAQGETRLPIGGTIAAKLGLEPGGSVSYARLIRLVRDKELDSWK
ncbi:hypothetical protein ACFWF7_16365 [Nocardia sp. NPDC060256]|uniref:hypothetical protein n=1 Tax=unclassified Nocardia TaxID=2637762 RepID=UPI00364FAFD0